MKLLPWVTNGLWGAGVPSTGGTHSYVSPSITYIKQRTGINRAIERLATDDSALDAKLAALLPEAEAIVALRVGESLFYSLSLTLAQATALKGAVACRTGVLYLNSPEVQVGTGSQAPLMMNGTTIDMAREALSLEARQLESLVMGGIYRDRALLRVRS